jgi:UDP-N-acetylmuramoylalanine--D-glutamate ligase
LNKRLVILGSGESGTGAALLALQQGYDVFISDMGLIKEKYKSVLNQKGIAYEEGQHTFDRILEADIIIKSPGIPEKAEVMKDSYERYSCCF